MGWGFLAEDQRNVENLAGERLDSESSKKASGAMLRNLGWCWGGGGQ